MPGKRRILIVDGHSLVRPGLAALIDAEADLIVCAQSAERREGIAAIVVARPDPVIDDLSLFERPEPAATFPSRR